MSDKLSCLKPEHGVQFNINLAKASTRDALKRMVDLQNEAGIYLYILGMSRNGNIVTVPCKQCFMDAALQYEEVASLMRELANDK